MDKKHRLIKNNILSSKKLLFVCLIFICTSSCTTLKLSLPDSFVSQAYMTHVKGTRKKKMRFGNYYTSKIKRGLRLERTRRGGENFWENIVLRKIGIQNASRTTREKQKFKYTLYDSIHKLYISGRETKVDRQNNLAVFGTGNIFTSLSKNTIDYNYILTANIDVDTLHKVDKWQMVMTDSRAANFFDLSDVLSLLEKGDCGFATNGKDSIFIKPVLGEKLISNKGKEVQLLFKKICAFELHTHDGLLAIVDVIGNDIWYYKDLNIFDRLMASGIASIILARRVSITRWQ